MMKVAILAGGLGTRLSEETVRRPKPMVEVGDKPLLWHLMMLFASQGLNDFVLALGYRSDIIKDYFVNFCRHNNDVSVDLGSGDVMVHAKRSVDWKIDLVETGLNTQTGGRLRRLRPWLRDSTFIATYGDGLADVDVRALVAFHRSHGKLATVTAVRPPSRFGSLETDGSRVARFVEKPQIGEGWINGGFFVLEPEALDAIDSDTCIWERGPLEKLALAGELQAYHHDGFFQPMDTLRDKRNLDGLWADGNAPWKVWL